jgi:MYXO-CTERM domain-containing protein
MKKLLLTAAAILATLNMYGADGAIGFSSAGTAADNRVYVTEDPSTPYMNGVPAGGTAYNIAFYWREPLIPGNEVFRQIGAPIAFLTGGGAGQFLGGNRTIQGMSVPGAVVEIQAKAWETAFGASYDEVVNRGQGHAGVSGIVTIKSKDPANTLETTPVLTSHPQWNGFALTPVPEPSVIGLGLLGVGALLMLRRRK